MDGFLYALAELLAALLGLLWPLILGLPPPVLGGLIAVTFLMATYNKGWNDSLKLARDNAKRRADEDYKRLKR